MAKIIKHIGTKRHSGRYPWGSGGHSQQRDPSFLGMVEQLMSQGLSETEIAATMGVSTTSLRQLKTIEKEKRKAADISQVYRLKQKGLSNVAIGERIGKNESSVRALLAASEKENFGILSSTKDMLTKTISEKGPIDVGVGVEASLGISRNKLNAAVKAAELDGYQVMYVRETQLGTGEKTSIKVLAPPGMEYKELYAKRAEIAQITDTSVDNGRSYLGLRKPQVVKSNRIEVAYKGEGGELKDGTIEMRRGVKDLDLGNAQYAQVRIDVDGTHYMKGMAFYSDNLPPGVDIRYNVSKPRTDDPMGAFKSQKDDPDNPFGATIKAGGQKGALNIVYEEGDWNTWSRNISSQILSKQSTALAKKQLNLAQELMLEEFADIQSLTNPAVKARLLQAFADQCDAAAVDLQAAALPRQNTHVILPLVTGKPNEIYAPMYQNGERLVLLRHPHGGIFEIPDVVVNNKMPEAKAIMANAKDAIGVHPSVAAKLSGADFDGDTVIAIPNKNNDIRTAPSLAELKDFDTKTAYPPYDGMKTIDGGRFNAATGKVDYPPGKKPSGRRKQLEMGDVSNLITDMTIKGATPAEIARAVKHSMVVIDAEKHHLNSEQSFIDNNIAELKTKYQGGPRAGASTVVSRASSEYRVPLRKPGVIVTDPVTGKTRRKFIDPETGEKLYEILPDEDRYYVTPKGVRKERQTVTTKMEQFSAFDLSSGTPMETLYATHAESLKGLANRARLELLATPKVTRDPQAAKVYAQEVDSLNAKLKLADINRPKERKAQLVANKIYNAKLAANPNMDPSDKSRLRGQALSEARIKLGAKKPEFTLTDREWTAIQLGALSHNKVSAIIQNVDMGWLKEKANPRPKFVMSDAKVKRAKSMAALGYTQAEIATALGVSASSISTTLNP